MIELLQKLAELAPEEVRLKEMKDEGERFWILAFTAFGQRIITLLDEPPSETDLAYVDTLILGAVIKAFADRQQAEREPNQFTLKTKNDGFAAIVYGPRSVASGHDKRPGVTALTAYIEYLEGLA